MQPPSAAAAFVLIVVVVVGAASASLIHNGASTFESLLPRVNLNADAASASGKAVSSANNISLNAQAVADLACPYAMMHGYGCPIPQSPEAAAQKQRGRAASVVECTNPLGGCEKNKAGAGLGAGAAPPNMGTQQERQWPIGTVPVGVGFDTTTMSVKLPFYYPEGSWQHVFAVELHHKTFNDIDDYVGSLDPTAVSALMTGALNTDVSQVYSTYFGSYSSMHQTTQVDIITQAQLSTTPTVLPRVQDALQYLPETYDATIYSEFIRYWGTHVVTSAAIGGAAEMLISVKSCFASGNVALLQAASQEELGVKTMQQHLPTGQSVNQAFMEHMTSETITMYGGDVTLIEPSQWPERQRSIAEAPVLIKVNAMTPIADLMPDAARKANMATAVNAYQQQAKEAMQKAAAAAKAKQTYHIQAATTVDFNGVQARFNYRQHHCHRCWIFAHCCHCDGETACFTPGSCGTGCGGDFSNTMVVTDMPTATLQPGGSQTFSPDGSRSCACSNYGGFETPTWPLNNLDQNFECSINAAGQLVASNVRNPGVGTRQQGGSVHQEDGQPVTQGCSIAKATYTGLAWEETGGNQGCGSSTETLSMSGTVTANGWCCMGTTLAANWNSPGCYGQLEAASCPGFND